jgi:hypothetical protein
VTAPGKVRLEALREHALRVFGEGARILEYAAGYGFHCRANVHASPTCELAAKHGVIGFDRSRNAARRQLLWTLEHLPTHESNLVEVTEYTIRSEDDGHLCWQGTAEMLRAQRSFTCEECLERCDNPQEQAQPVVFKRARPAKGKNR